MGAPIVIAIPSFSISFMGFGIGKKLQQREGEVLGPAQLAAAGALSGVMTTIVMAPGARVKCLLQVSTSCVQLYVFLKKHVTEIFLKPRFPLHKFFKIFDQML